MGTVSTPGVPKAQPPAAAPSPDGAPPAGPETAPPAPATGRLRIPEKKLPLGPRVSTIVAVIAVAAWLIWVVTRPPQRVPMVTLPRFTSIEENLGQGSPRDCTGKGCLLVIIGTDPKTHAGIPSAVEMSDELSGQGVETTFVVAGDALKECARVARLFRRPVLLDPEGELSKALSIPALPYWVVYNQGGRVLHRSGESMTASDVVRAAGI